MSSEKRRHYRPSPPEPDALSIDVKHRTRLYRALVLNTSMGGVALSLETGPAIPVLEPGQTVYLRISAPSLPAPLDEPCTVEHRTQSGSEMLYGLRIVDWMGFLERIPADLAELFNRRTTRRAESPGARQVQISAPAGERAYEARGTMVDISPDGLSFTVPSSVGEELLTAGAMTLTFRLPNAPGDMTFSARIRHVTESEERWTLGVYFEAEESIRFSEQQNVVIDYVTRALLDIENIPAR